MCSKGSKTSAEGMLRSDKGVKEEKNVSNWEYMKKALHFAKPHWLLILTAFLFLFISSGTCIVNSIY